MWVAQGESLCHFWSLPLSVSQNATQTSLLGSTWLWVLPVLFLPFVPARVPPTPPQPPIHLPSHHLSGQLELLAGWSSGGVMSGAEGAGRKWSTVRSRKVEKVLRLELSSPGHTGLEQDNSAHPS
jgi:hypothetical protein